MLTVLRNRAAAPPSAASAAANARFYPQAVSSCWTATGRAALRHLHGVLRPSAVLLPAYVPEGVIHPFQSLGVPVLLYGLTADLSPEPVDFAAKLTQAGDRPLGVVIHYFGYPSPSSGMRKMLHAAGGWLLEDCAHALGGLDPTGQPLGAEADFVLYSYNKFLPTPDGALLLSRRSDADLTLDAGSALLPPEVLAAYEEHLSLNTALVGSEDPASAQSLMARTGAAYERYYAYINRTAAVHGVSPASRALANAWPLERLNARRGANARALHRLLQRRARFRPLHSDVPKGAAPFAVPVLTGRGEREMICQRLLTAGVAAAYLVDKWDFVPRVRGAFSVELDFMQTHLLLPCGEDLGEADLRRIAAAIEEADEHHGHA